MSIVSLRQSVIDDYQKYVQSFLLIDDDRLRRFIEDQIAKGILWPELLLQLNPAYEPASSVYELCAQGKRHRLCSEIFYDAGRRQPFRLYRHQQEAIERVLRNEPVIVTSGTGSGKSLAYFVPIFNAVIRENPSQPKVQAIVVYPMNALVNSQELALTSLAEGYKRRTGNELPVRFGKYTGQEQDQIKRQLQENPPHVLLTNYVMLELMLVRPDEQHFVDRGTTAPKFFAIDEVHTYRGRQGADVALLVRRLRERCGNPNLLCIGTSATMATGGSRLERRKAVAEFASKLFGGTIDPENVVEESLRQAIPRTTPTDQNACREALSNPVPPATWDEFSRNPVSAWIEDTFGLVEEEGSNLRRRMPITLTEGGWAAGQGNGGDSGNLRAAAARDALAGRSGENTRWNPGFRLQVAPVHCAGRLRLRHARTPARTVPDA